MFYFLFLLTEVIHVCISQYEPSQTDCTEWLPPEIKLDYLFNNSNFQSIPISSREQILIGVGNVPDLPIDLSTLATTQGISDNIDLVINVTDPKVNDIVTFDFDVYQFDDLNSLTFNELQLKPFNTSKVHTTSTNHKYELIFNHVIFLDGYIFESDIFKPLSRFQFGDVTVVEPKERWATDGYLHIPFFTSFYFTTDTFTAYNNNYTYYRDYYQQYGQTLQDEDLYMTLSNDKFVGKLLFYTDYTAGPIYFTLKNCSMQPTVGFTLYTPSNIYDFSGGWGDNITLNNDGFRCYPKDVDYAIINATNISTCYEDTVLPISVNFNSTFGQTTVDIFACADSITLNSVWDIHCPTSFNLNNNSKTLQIQSLTFFNSSSAAVRTDFANKKFLISDVTINDNVTYTLPGQTNAIFIGVLLVRPGANLILSDAFKFDKNLASLRLMWDSVSGFPLLTIEKPELLTSKQIPIIYFVDNEPLEKISDANNTYEHMYQVPMKLICGIGIENLDMSRFFFQSPNPSFQENGVWKYFWAKNEETNENCLYMNMTKFPEIPFIPPPTPTKDPAAVSKNAMYGMIATFAFLFVSAVLGYFSRFLPQNVKDRERERMQKEQKETDDGSEMSEATKLLMESDISDHASSFIQNLSEYSDDNELFPANQFNDILKFAVKSPDAANNDTASFESDQHNPEFNLGLPTINRPSQKADVTTPLLENESS